MTFSCTNETGLPAAITIIKGEPGSNAVLSSTISAPPLTMTVMRVPKTYTAYFVTTSADGMTHQTATINLPGDSVVVTAKMLAIEPPGTYNIWLETAPGTVPYQFTIYNECNTPGTFFLFPTGQSEVSASHMQAAIDAPPAGTVPVNTAETYTLQAEVDGITTAPLTVQGCPRISLVREDGGYALKITP